MFIFKLVVIIILIFIYLTIKQIRKRRYHPPGPLGIPIYGFLKIVLSSINSTSDIDFFRQMTKKYGEIWSMEIGSRRIITLASLDVVREALVDNGMLFSGFPKDGFYHIFGENRGILFVEGDIWKRNRLLAVKSLRELGIGKTQFETVICDEGNNLIKELENVSNIPIKTPIIFGKCISNVISYFNFYETNEDNSEFEKYILNVKFVSRSNIISIISLWPKFFLSSFGRWIFKSVDNYLTAIENNRKFISVKCLKRLKNYNKSSSPKCTFDYFWNNQDDDILKNKYENFKFLNIVQSLTDLQNAGSETTNSILGFCCIMLARYPIIQNDLRNELKQQIDDYKQINMNLRKSCPKLLSFIDEIQRFCNLIPKVYHRVLEKCVFRGYEFLPDDIIFGDLGSIFRDENLFKNPDLFDPYRFLDETRTEYIPNKNLIPFGVGKRICLGESIANMEIFIFLSKIIYKFNLKLPKETDENFEKILEGEVGLIHSLLEHEIIFQVLN